MEADVISYIKEARTQGITDTEIKQNLLNAGWDPGVVEESFGFVKVSSSKPVPSKEELAKAAEKPDNHPQETKPILPTSGPVKPEAAVFPTQSAAGQAASQTLTEKDFHTGPQSGRRRKLPLLIGALVVVLLSAGAYVFYVFGYTNPTAVWNKFTSGAQSRVYESDFSVTYSDKGTVDQKNNPFTGFEFKDLKLAFDGKFYVDATNEENPQSGSTIKYTFSSGNMDIGAGLDYKLINKILYVNVGNNPLLNNFFRNLNPDRTINWVKLDLNEIQNELGTGASAEQQAKLNNAFGPQWQKEVEDIWKNANIVKVERYVGKEDINGKQTLHFINSVDKIALKQALNTTLQKFIDAMASTGEQLPAESDKQIALVKRALSALVDKLNITQLETWVGTKDFQLYKIQFASNAPSFISLMNNTVGEARQSSRDAKRLADVRQLAAALELYFNDRGGYPAGSGTPQDLSPVYIGQMPTAPVPADGGCTDYYNGYWYEAKGQPTQEMGITVYPSYELTFCLGSTLGGYSAGIGRLTPQGIASNIACPSTPEQCGTAGQIQAPAVEKTEEELVQEFVDKLDFSAELRIDGVYSNYGVTQTLEVPSDAFDLFEVIKGSVMGAFIDARK